MILIIDNYDSFTYNLVQYFKQIDKDVLVFRNDQITVRDIEGIAPDLIVLSPGPGTPAETGVCREVLQEFYRKIPILGICLGHQLIVEFFGGKVEKGQRPMHGKVTSIIHDGRTVFADMPESVKVTRYHSLHTPEDQLPDSLEMSATSVDGVVMAIRHRDFPIEGLQFHPESILTECGFDMLCNFCKKAMNVRQRLGNEVLV